MDRSLPSVLARDHGAVPLSYPQSYPRVVAVYVDHAFAHGDWGRWTGGGHLQADSREELLVFAARLSVEARWLQTRPGRPERDHFDLTAALRERALSLGATPEDRRAGVVRRRAARDELTDAARAPRRAAAAPR